MWMKAVGVFGKVTFTPAMPCFAVIACELSDSILGEEVESGITCVCPIEAIVADPGEGESGTHVFGCFGLVRDFDQVVVGLLDEGG